MKKTKPIKKTIRSRCGANPPGFFGSCWLAPGHDGNHRSRTADWPQSPVKAHIATAPHCGAVDTVNGWFCELAPGHSGEHQCGEYRWAHSYQEAAPPPPAPQYCGSKGCTLPPGHTGWHGDDKYTWHRLPPDTCDPEAEEPSWYSASPKREQPDPLTQKLVLHLESGDVELSEVEAKALREYLNRIYLTPRFCGEPYVISGMVSDGAIARQCDPGTVTVTGLDGKSFTLTNAVVTHHFYHGKKP